VNNNNNLTKEQEEKIVELYKSGKGQQYCAKAVGISNSLIVKKVLKKYGIKIRTFSESATLSNKQRKFYRINDEYFKTESSNMAYILGFLAADGTVRKNTNEIKVTVSAVDRDFLVMLNEELESEYIVKDFITSQGYSASTLAFTSETIKHDLAAYNVVPTKTFNFKFPEKLNKKYWIDFIRGYFDGDGSVSTAGNCGIKWQLCSATEDVLKHVVDFFYEEYGIPKVTVRKEKRVHDLFVIAYSTNATKKIYEILYSEDSLYLKRKKDKFDTLVNN